MKRICILIQLIIFPLLLSCGNNSGNTSSSHFDAENNEIIQFGFSSAKNTELGIKADVIGSITGNSIALEVPYNTNITSLVAEFATNSSNIKVNGVSQQNGITSNDFTNPVAYSVFADNGDEKKYTVTVAKAPSSEKNISSFTINGTAGVIDTGKGTITVTLPPHSSTTAIASFSAIGKSISVNGTMQQSGVTSNDFSSPVVYTVTADDGSTAVYTVAVTVEKSSEKSIAEFKFRNSENSVLTDDVSGIITGTNIELTLPYASSISGLIAYFTTDGISVTMDGNVQESGITSNDFSGTKTYTVTAEDGSTQDYSVTVKVAKNSAKTITSFLLGGEKGTIDETAKTITILFQSTKNVTSLSADFVTTGDSVSVNNVTQESGITYNDFTNPLVYTVTAENGTTCEYTVTAVKSADISGIWNFEYTSDGSYTESSTGITDVQGLTGTAILLDGMTGYVLTPDSDALTLAEGGSIEAVVKCIKYTSYGGIVHKGVLTDFSDEAYSLQFWGASGTGVIRFLVHNTTQGDDFTYVDSKTKLQLNKWYHIVATWNTAGLAIYINGTLDSSLTADVGKVRDTAGGLVIGAQLDRKYTYSAWGNLGFNGIIDRVEIYNKSLTADEVSVNYQNILNIAGSGFTAYILSAAKHNMPVLLNIFAVIIIVLAAIYFYNRKKVKTAE